MAWRVTMKNWTEAAVMKWAKSGKEALGGGLYLRTQLGPNGLSKSYTFRWSKHGKAHEKSLGPITKLRLAEARAIAAGYSADIFRGREIGQSSKSPDFAALVAESLPRLTATLCPESQRDWKQMCGVAAEHFGRKPISEISLDDVTALLDPMWNKQPVKVDRLRARVARLFDCAIAKKYRTDNPAAIRLVSAVLGKLKRPPHRHHASMYWEDLPQVWNALGDGAWALKLLILTGSRAKEVLRASIGEFDMVNAEWTRPAERMKSRRPHIVPLSSQALELVERLANSPSMATGQHLLFPRMWHKELIDTLRDITETIEPGSDLTVHGLRGTLSTWMERQGVPVLTREFILAHNPKDAVAESYLETHQGPERRLLEDRRKALQQWADFVTSTA